MRPIIYQLFVRHFSNSCTTGVKNGSLSQNGCGSFDGVNELALESIARMGVSHLWLTGILRHATQTNHPGLPATPASVVKGIAGSPYAVLDYYDVDPDLATSCEARMEEFSALIARVRRFGMVPMIDFVPNHVSRCYDDHRDNSLGQADDTNRFFTRDNAFYYLEAGSEGPPLTLPHGVFNPEIVRGRVTGNNAATWTPSEFDWYETIKLNYGADYRCGAAASDHLPGMMASREEVPRTWREMDAIIEHWQKLGVGGFRCDMAHMIPMPFWRWCIARARLRDSAAYFMAEGYDDHMKMCEGSVHPELLAAGFDGVYDACSYESLRHIYEQNHWANDLDACHQISSPLFVGGVRYLENHDEPRLCSPQFWGGEGERVLPALLAAQYASSAGPVLLYNGQEFGERAEGPSGYGGDNGRSSIFDYTCLPRLQKWANGGKFDGAALSKEQVKSYGDLGRLIPLLQMPALAQGEFYGLNWSNQQTEGYGRGEGDEHSGRHFYAFIRYHRKSKSTVLVLCNLSASQTIETKVHIPRAAQEWCRKYGQEQRFYAVWGEEMTLQCSAEQLDREGLPVSLPAGEALILSWD